MYHRRAFTLIELSIVLVILGLLIGGVMGGQHLLRAQSLRNVLQEAKTYAIAKQLFAEKYGALPGDMPDAIRVWGNADGSGDATIQCAHPDTDVSVGRLTCNGDGNGIIDPGKYEVFRAWQQLSAAGMIGGSYTGVHGSGGILHALPRTNVPASALDGGIFMINSLGEQPDGGGGLIFAGDYNNMIMLGKVAANSWPSNAPLTAIEAYEMDAKVDDGIPGLGSIRAQWPAYAPGPAACTSGATGIASSYVKTNKGQNCLLIFMSAFEVKPQ